MKQALLVTNLTARTVSVRLKQVIVKALSADLKLEVADTEARHHATELASDAAENGFDFVIVFGGDGTMNEVANALVGTDTALALLPGGMANVLCRTIGIPIDIVEATGYLLNRIQSGTTRRINVGRMDGRYFIMSCGIGLDAATVRRVEENPAAKRRYRDWFFIYSAFRAAIGEYRGKDPYIRVTSEDISEEVVLAIVSNIPQLTYFKRWPVTITPEASLESGLDLLGMKRFPMRYIPPLFWSTLRSRNHVNWKQIVYKHDVNSVTLKSESDTFPIQVDGEFVGDRRELQVDLVPNGLSILN
jgi:diacylglycerol kinase family enzyme